MMIDYEKKYGEMKDIYISTRLDNLFDALLLLLYVDDKVKSGVETLGSYPFLAAAYGTEYENKIFSLHPYCWCEKDDCEYCFGNKPLFIHKPSGFAMSWYKYWPRGVTVNRYDPEEIERIFVDCIDSVYRDED